MRSALLVFVGGALGTLARYGVAEGLQLDATWPWPTFLVNLTGSLALGLLVARVNDPADPRRLLLGTGVLGGYTTYSAFAVEVAEADVSLAVAYALASVVLGTVAAAAGLTLGRRR